MTNWTVAMIQMKLKVELQATGVNELKAKVAQAEKLVNDLKTVLNEISEASCNVSLSPIIKGKDLSLAVNRANKRTTRLL